MKILVADTSPLISLILIDKLNLLFSLFNEVFIPPAVLYELQNHNELSAYKKELQLLAANISYPKTLVYFSGIDKGETEAIALYHQLNATFLLIDDKKGREVAEANNINCIGTLAVLISAKHKNLIPEIKPYFEMLLSKKRFYQKDTLNQILASEDEPLL